MVRIIGGPKGAPSGVRRHGVGIPAAYGEPGEDVKAAQWLCPVKAASAAIAFYHRVNLFDHGPTQCPAVCLVRNAAMRRFGVTPKNWNDPFM